MLKSHTMTGLISSVPFEADLLLDSFKRKKISAPLVEGTIGERGKKAAYICSGIGIANAARAVAILAERKKPEAIFLFGIGGAYPSSGLKKGDLAAAEVEIYAEGGLIRGKGWAKTGGASKVQNYDGFRVLGFPLLKKDGKVFFSSFPLDRRLLKEAKKHIPDLRTGRFLTVCAAGRSTRKAGLLGAGYGAIVENMEGAAAAHTALFYGIPLIEIRGISNMAGEPPSKWRKQEAARNCQTAVLRLLEFL
ncbi:MAG: futalosine hydrolase [Nitrospiraceae bacterium]|nr:futalosine hydrolase [Nitrospiraceae bacterium]